MTFLSLLPVITKLLSGVTAKVESDPRKNTYIAISFRFTNTAQEFDTQLPIGRVINLIYTF